MKISYKKYKYIVFAMKMMMLGDQYAPVSFCWISPFAARNPLLPHSKKSL